ncbi:MAG: hypothetical protein KIT09_28505 [Bryobacteraceae bacterium]|nr:hypothetical protein [Bryobacteraceae bacterium]
MNAANAVCFRCAGLASLLVWLGSAGAGLGQPDTNLVYQIFVRSFADTPADAAPASEKGEVGDAQGNS